jgi:DNA-binding transcriptional LysR family regulator
LADLTDEPFVWYPQPPGSSYGRLVEACRAGGLSLNVIQEAESQEILLELVAMGLGATFVASSIAGHETLRNVVLKEVADLTAMFALEVVWRRDNPKPLLATFTEAVTNVLRKKEADVTDQREPDLATS